MTELYQFKIQNSKYLLKLGNSILVSILTTDWIQIRAMADLSI